jgi:catechol 2,3-dioxygenase-like lactoylglutathione lyase family enzyme
MNHIHIITLGVKEINRSLKFYRALGFQTSVQEENPGIVFFQNGGTTLALYPREKLAEDISEANPPQGEGFGGITLAHNVREQNEVDKIMELAEKAGAKIVKKPQRVFWGGYSGYFADPDGYYWEVAHGENWQFNEDGSLVID